MKFAKFFLFSVLSFSILNCAELFQSRDKKDNTDALFAALFASPSCGPSAVSGSAGNGTRYLFTGCSGDPTSVLRAFGFTSSGVTFNAGIQGTSLASTIITNASSLSTSGNDSKAGIEITYLMNQGDSLVDALVQSTSSFAGPGVQFSPTQAQWLNGSTPSAFVTTPSIAWTSSVGIEKTVCIEVHKENANAHIFGWSSACNSVNRSAYEFEEEDAVITGFTGDRVGLKINKAVIKSITIYSTVIGTAGSLQ